MAKPTKHATIICSILTIIAIVGIYFGWREHNVLIVLIALLPAVVYEIYRTEGESTRWASWMMLLTILAEIYFIWKKVSFDLSQYLGASEQYVGGYQVPLGDIKIVAPILLAVLSGILFFRTNGKYTKWLSVIIFVSAFMAIYLLDKNILQNLLQSVIRGGSFWY